MGHRDRASRASVAFDDGWHAYRAGQDLEDCPHGHGKWSLGGFWCSGWNSAANDPESRRMREDPLASLDKGTVKE